MLLLTRRLLSRYWHSKKMRDSLIAVLFAELVSSQWIWNLTMRRYLVFQRHIWKRGQVRIPNGYHTNLTSSNILDTSNLSRTCDSCIFAPIPSTWEFWDTLIPYHDSGTSFILYINTVFDKSDFFKVILIDLYGGDNWFSNQTNKKGLTYMKAGYEEKCRISR